MKGYNNKNPPSYKEIQGETMPHSRFLDQSRLKTHKNHTNTFLTKLAFFNIKTLGIHDPTLKKAKTPIERKGPTTISNSLGKTRVFPFHETREEILSKMGEKIGFRCLPLSLIL